MRRCWSQLIAPFFYSYSSGISQAARHVSWGYPFILMLVDLFLVVQVSFLSPGRPSLESSRLIPIFHCPFGQTLRKLNLACNGIRQVCAGKSWFRKNSVLVFVIFLVCCKFWPHFLTQMHWNTSNSCIALWRPSRFCSRIVVHSPFKCVRICFQSAKVCKCIWHIFCTWLDVFSILVHHILIFCSSYSHLLLAQPSKCGQTVLAGEQTWQLYLASIVALFSLYRIRNVDIAHCTLNMIFPL